MEASPRSDSVLELGRQLVAELGLEKSTDTLSRWMAHYIAELIEVETSAAVEERPSARKLCFDAILSLWDHRTRLPDGKRPFETLEPVMRAVESLDPEGSRPRYFGQVLAAVAEDGEEGDALSLLQLVDLLDSTAKSLIAHTLGEAARSAAVQSRKWVALAEQAELNPGSEAIVVRFLSDKVLENLEANAPSARLDVLRARVNQLEAFIATANALVGELKAHLTASTPSE